jgi:NTE family protein
MDVDIVIAVDVEFPLYAPEHLQSALDITGQMLTIMIRRETRRQLATLGDRDILIRPQLGEYGSTNFAQIADVIEPGREAAQAVEDRLAALSVSEAEYRRFLSRQRAPAFEYPVADFVRVRDAGPFAPGVLESRLKSVAGERINPATLAEDASGLYGLSTYEAVDYHLVTENGQTGVEFVTHNKSWGPNFLKAGISLEDDFEGATAFNVAARLTMTGLNSLAAEWRNDLQLGTDPYLRSEFYQPLSFDSRYFVAPHVRVEQRNFSVFSETGRGARYRISEAVAGLDVGREIGRWGELRIGAFRSTGNGRLKTGDPGLPNFDFEEGGLFAKFRVDTLDDAQIPKSGVRASLEWTDSRRSFGADADSDYFSAVFDKAWSWGQHDNHTIQAGLEYHTTYGADPGINNYFPLGGFLQLSGLDRGAISGPHAALARLLYYREIRSEGGGFFSLPLYVGGSVETGNVWQERSLIGTDSLITNGSLFAGVDTWFGLLMLGAGFAEDGKSSFFLFLGSPSY